MRRNPLTCFTRLQLLTIEGLLSKKQRAEHPDYEPDLNFITKLERSCQNILQRNLLTKPNDVQNSSLTINILELLYSAFEEVRLHSRRKPLQFSQKNLQHIFELASRGFIYKTMKDNNLNKLLLRVFA